MSDIPMVSVRVMSPRVVELLREASVLLDQNLMGAPSDVLDLRHAVNAAYKDALRIENRESQTDLARRRYVEAARFRGE